jgi:hypothetical protein
MAFADDLKNKILSEDEWTALLVKHRASVLAPGLAGVGTKGPVSSPWWVRREYARIREGVYPTSVVTERINGHYPHLAVHASTEDSRMVAYTPDSAFGVSDRQLRTSLGKLLRKLYPYEQDHDLEAVVTEHNADISNEIEFVTGDDIIAAYDNGCASCMTDKSSRQRGNPLQAYNAPHIRLAVLRDGSGKVKARCLVYEPSPDDLRFIRVYGDQTLKKRLIRRGYKPGTWHGAKFNTISIGDDKYLMPYLDGSDDRGGISKSCVALLDGVITGIPGDIHHRLIEKHPAWSTCSTNTSGFITLVAPDYASFVERDILTGEEVNSLYHNMRSVFVNGEVGLSASVPDDWVVCKVGAFGRALVSPDTPMFRGYNENVLDTEANRRDYGWDKLDATLYPEEQDWRKGVTLTQSGQRIKEQDAVRIVYNKSDIRIEHKSHVTKKHTLLHKDGGSPIYAETKDDFVRTTTGRKVSLFVHEAVRLWSGEVRFKRGLRDTYLSGRDVWYEKGSPPTVESEIRYHETLGVEGAIRAVLGTRAAIYNGGTRYLSGTAPLYVIIEHLNFYSRTDYTALRIYLDRVLAEAYAVEYPSPALTPAPAVVAEATSEVTTEPQPELEIA